MSDGQRQNGAKYYFREELFSDSQGVPKNILKGVIAHELAHSFYALEERGARMKETLSSVWNESGQAIETPERRAIRKATEYLSQQLKIDLAEGKAWFKAEAWGFDQHETLAWLQQNLP